MPTSFANFMNELDAEAHADGLDAVVELRTLRFRFSLARQLVAHRHERRLTQKQLAQLSGVPQRAIGQIERGQTDAPMAALAALTRALEVDVRLVDR